MYESFYKLRGKPFQLNPDPSFYFASRGHKRAMSYLEYGLHQGEGFIVITGEIGAGKTTLVKNLFRRVDPHSFVAAQLVSTQLDADDTLRLIAAAFGLKHEDQSKAILLKRLEEYLLGVARQGRRALLVVDEAQNLTPRAVEELRMLSNFQTGEKSLLQSFLLGQPEFRYTLQGEGMQQLRQRIIASYHLGPMDAAETRAYIEHRMKTVGWGGDPEFSEDCFGPIYDYTGGIPRRINTLCDRVLLFGYLEDRHRIDAQTVEAVIGDLNGEMPTLAANEVGSSRVAARKSAQGEDRMLEQLDRRVSKMERSIVNILKLSRELLNLAHERQPEKRDGS
ncbi:MAG: AAA family ATPase [Burkholderiales bacterium]|nr:AAA family ATPase [Burkholderiales bacterium]